MQNRPAILLTLLLGAVTLGGATAGCLADATVFVLEYRLVDLAGSERIAQPGDHCGTASKRGDTLTIDLGPGDQRPPEPWLTVFPELPETWDVYDDNPFRTTFPWVVDPQVQDDNTTLGTLTWNTTSGTVHLDGDPITLPHTWTVTTPDGSWRADATLSSWEGDVDVRRNKYACD